MFKHALTTAAMATALLSGAAAFAGGPEIPVAPECEHCFRPFVGVYYSYLRVNHHNNWGGGWWDNSLFVSDPIFTFNNYYVNWSGWGSNNRNANGIGFEAGAKYGPYFGFAFGMDYYFRRTTSLNFNVVGNTIATGAFVFSTSNTINFNRSFNNYYIEARGYWPIGEGFDLIGAIGGDILHGHTSWGWGNWYNTTGTAPVFAAAGVGNNLFGLLPWLNQRSHTTLAWRFGIGADYMFTPNWGVQAMFHYMPTLESNNNGNNNSWWWNNNTNWNGNNNNSNNNNFWNIDAGLFYLFS